MALKQNTAEGGTNGVTVTTANSGGSSGDALGSVSLVGSPTIIFDNSTAAHGSLSYYLSGADTERVRLTLNNPSSPSKSIAFRTYINIHSYPVGSDANIAVFQNSLATNNFTSGINITTSGKCKMVPMNGTGSQTGTTTLSLNTWYRVEFQIDVGTTSTNSNIRLQLYQGDSTTALETLSNAAADSGVDTLIIAYFGKATSAGSFTASFDDIAFSTDSSTPLGPASAGVSPTANAGPDQTNIEPWTTVTLDGTGSIAGSGSITGYSWTQTAGTSVSLSSASAPNPTFTAPGTLAGVTLAFSLVVTNSYSQMSSPATVNTTILYVSERAVISGSEVPVRTQVVQGGSLQQMTEVWTAQGGQLVRRSRTPGSGLGWRVGSLPVGDASYDIPSSNRLFVAPSGSDSSGDGSQANPYKTLANAFTQAASGWTIILRAGSYQVGGDTQSQSLSSLQLNKPITIQSYPNEAVWFDGSDTLTSWTQEGSQWWAPYDRVFDRSVSYSSGAADGSGTAGGTWLDPAHPEAAWPDRIFRDGIMLTQATSKAAATAGKFFIEGSQSAQWFTGTKVWVGDDPTGHEMRYAKLVRALTGHAANITIRGIGIRRYATQTSKLGTIFCDSGASNVLLENMWWEDLSASAVHLDHCANITFRWCTCRGMGLQFCATNFANYLLFDMCDIQQCNTAQWALDGPALAAIKLTKANQSQFDRGVISNNASSGFWTDQACDRPRVTRSVISDNAYYGVEFELSAEGVLAGNLLVRNGMHAFYNCDTDATKVVNNTFYDNMTSNPSGNAHVRFFQTTRRASNLSDLSNLATNYPPDYYDPVLHPEHQYQINHFMLRNNVLVRGTHGDRLLQCQDTSDDIRDYGGPRPTDPFPTWGPDLDYDYWSTAGSTYPVMVPGATAGVLKSYSSIAAFQVGTGQEPHGVVGSSPIGLNDRVPAGWAGHSNAGSIPSDVATLLGVSTTPGHMGCWV